MKIFIKTKNNLHWKVWTVELHCSCRMDFKEIFNLNLIPTLPHSIFSLSNFFLIQIALHPSLCSYSLLLIHPSPHSSFSSSILLPHPTYSRAPHQTFPSSNLFLIQPFPHQIFSSSNLLLTQLSPHPTCSSSILLLIHPSPHPTYSRAPHPTFSSSNLLLI